MLSRCRRAHPSRVESRVVLGFVSSWAWRRHQHVLNIQLELTEHLGVTGADLLQHIVARLVQTRPHSACLRVVIPVNPGSIDQAFLSSLAYAQVKTAISVVVVVAAVVVGVVVVVLKASTRPPRHSL